MYSQVFQNNMETISVRKRITWNLENMVGLSQVQQELGQKALLL